MKVIFTTCLLFFLASTFATAQTVFSETFNGSSTPAGWTNTATTGGPWTFSTGAGYTVSSILDHTGNGGNYAWIDFSGTDVGVILETPVIDVSSLTTPYLQFYFESHYNGTLNTYNLLHLEAWNGTAWVNVTTLQGDTGYGWDEYGYNMSAFVYGGTNLRVRFRGESGGASNDYNNDLLLDDVAVMELPTCPTPNNLSAANVTATTADFTWTENGTATNWQLQYGLQGFALGTGTNVFTTNNNPHAQTGLPSSSTLDLYVRSICAPGDTSAWFGPINFTTLCVPIVAPWIESFNGGSTPNCWTESGSESWRYNTSAGYDAASAGDHTNNGGNYAWIDGSFPSGASQISTLTGPEVDVSALTTPLISYWVYSHNSNDNTYNTLTVDVHDGAAWNSMDTINSDQGNGWVNKIIDIQNLTITGPIKIRFTIAENSPGSAFYNDILIDDVEVKDAPNVSADTLLGLQPLYCNAIVNTSLVVSNRSGNTETDVLWTVKSNGLTIASGSIATFPANSSDTIPLTLGGVGPAGPNAMITAYTSLAADLTPADDTVVATMGMSYTGVNATVSHPVGCSGSSNGQIVSAGHSGIGTYTYLWNAAAAGQTSSTATGLAAGTYMLTVTDSIGCSSVATLTLNDPPAMSLNTSSTDLNCNGNNSGTATATVAGGVPGYTYQWSNGQMADSLMNLAAGVYTVTATDAYGCEMTSTVTLTEPSAMAATVADNTDGTATASVTGGVPTYSYQWSPNAGNQTTPTATGLNAGGVYYVVVTDANGCTDVVSFQATVLSSLSTTEDRSTLNMFPNPTRGNVVVELDLVEQADVFVNITNVTGQNIMSHYLGAITSSKVELETAELPTGIYMVQFNIGSEQITKKLIVTK